MLEDLFKATSQVTSLKTTTTNDLIFSTKEDGIKIFNLNTSLLKAHFSDRFLNATVDATTFNKTATTMAYATQKAIYVLDLVKKEFLKVIPIESCVKKMSFDQSSKYLITGDENGRVLQYSYLVSTPLSRLCSLNVSAMTSTKNLLALGSDDGKVMIVDIYSRTNNIVFKDSISHINALSFLNDNLLLCGDDDGLVSVYSTIAKKLLKQIQTPLKAIDQMIILHDQNFVLLSSKTNYLSIIDLKTYKTVHKKVVEFKDTVVKIASISQNDIAVVLKNNEVKKLTLADENDLRSLILHNSLDEAYKLVESEPMLKYTKAYKELEDTYNTMYKKALVALNANDEKLASKILSMFVQTASKREQVRSLFRSYNHLDDLLSLYKYEKTAICYALVAKYKELENTAVFRKLEAIWREEFRSAQVDMLKGNTSKAESTMQKYKTVASKKEMVDLVLKQSEEFKKFLLALDKNNYTEAERIANTNKILTKIPPYQRLQNELEYKVEQIESFIYEGEIKKAKTAIVFIENIPNLKDKVESFLKECEDFEILKSHYEKNNFKACYQTLDSYPDLKKTQLGELLEKHWATLMQKCEDFALKGDIIGLKQALSELATLKSRVAKLGDLFRLTFHVKIKEYLALRNFRDVERTIYRYIDIFGLDYEIKELMKKYEHKKQIKLAITQDPSTNRDSWIDSDFVNFT